MVVRHAPRRKQADVIEIRQDVIYPRSHFFSAMNVWWAGVLLLASILISTSVVAGLAFADLLKPQTAGDLMSLIGLATTLVGVLLVFAFAWPYSLVSSMLHGNGSTLKGELRFLATSPSGVLTGAAWVAVVFMATLGTVWPDYTAMWLTSTSVGLALIAMVLVGRSRVMARGRPSAGSPFFAGARPDDVDKYLGLGMPLRPTRDFPTTGSSITRKEAQGYAKLALQISRTRRTAAKVVSTLSTAFVASAAIWTFSGEPDPWRTLVVMLPVLGFVGGIALETRAKTYEELADAYRARGKEEPARRSRPWLRLRRRSLTPTQAVTAP
jgi:hypothetical protein